MSYTVCSTRIARKKLHGVPIGKPYILNALYWKSDSCIPRNETEQPRSKFLHSCICVTEAIYISPGTVCLFHRSQIHKFRTRLLSLISGNTWIGFRYSAQLCHLLRHKNSKTKNTRGPYGYFFPDFYLGLYWVRSWILFRTIVWSNELGSERKDLFLLEQNSQKSFCTGSHHISTAVHWRPCGKFESFPPRSRRHRTLLPHFYILYRSNITKSIYFKKFPTLFCCCTFGSPPSPPSAVS